jgi:hypothetical protein
MRRWLFRYVAISGYPNVNAYASAAGSRNVISRVRSWTMSCSRTKLVQAAVPEQAVPVLVDVHSV